MQVEMKYIVFFLSLLLFTSLTPSRVFASATQAVATPSATATASSQIDYVLAYPGILPDNLLYPLKMIRDAIVGFLIADPLKKAQFDLLQTDKRVNAALFLANSGDRKNLALSTLSKAANYFEQAIDKTRQAKKEGQDVQSFVNQLHLANEKHQQVVQEIQSLLPGNKRSDLDGVRLRLQSYQKQVNQLMPTR